MGRPVVHFEIGTTDAARSGDFYRALFDWDIRTDASGYGLVETHADAGIDGGILQTRDDVPSYVTFYVGVDDVDESLRQAEGLGAKVIMEPMPVGPIGSFAMFADLDGNAIGLFEETKAREETGSGSA